MCSGTKSHLCGPKPTHAYTKASCLSSAYLCSYHNTQFILGRPCLPKAHFCDPQPTAVAKEEAGWSSAYHCSITTLCASSAMSGSYQRHFRGPYSTFVATTEFQIVLGHCNTLCVLSLPPQHPCGLSQVL